MTRMTRQIRKPSVLGITMLLAIGAGQPRAAADIPPAMDRLPTDAGVVIAIPNISNLREAFNTLQAMFELDAADMQLGVGMEVFEAAGLKKDGSMAVAMVYPPAEGAGDEAGGEPNDEAGEGDEEEEPDFGMEDAGPQPVAIAIVPVTDYKAFVQGLGGDPSGALTALHSGEQELFGKDLGGGYAALSDNSDALGTFSGKGGSLGAYTALLGRTGERVSEASDVIFVMNLAILAPTMKEGLAGFRQNMELFGAMGQQDMAGASAMVQLVGDAFMRDGQAMIFGLDVGPEGLTVESAANFKEGTPTAGMLQDLGGHASGLLGSLPSMAQQGMAQQGFLLAGAMDTNAPGLKKLLQDYMAAQAKGDPAAAGAPHLLDWLSKCDGAAGVVGTSPALLGGAGLFINTVVFGKAADPKGLIAEFKKTTEALNGKTENNLTFTSSYKPGAATVATTPVDVWEVSMKMDPSDPNAANASMAMSMLFGPKGGPGGYVAPVTGGVVVTMGKNSALMETALKAAQGEAKSFAADPGVLAVAAMLPEGRTFEGYIGAKDILTMAMDLMAMFGQGPMDVEVPADLPPIGVGGTTQEGGLRVSTFLPTPVLKTFSAVFKAVNGDGMGGMDALDDGGEGEGQGGGRPRF